MTADGSGLTQEAQVEREATMTCTKCGEPKPLEQFRTQMSRGKPWRHRQCIACQSEIQRARRQLDDAYKARNRAAMARAQDPKRRERDAEYARNRRARVEGFLNRERVNINEARRKDVVKFLVRGAKSRSIKRGYDFDLTLELARLRWTGKCELTGIDFDWSKGVIHAFSPSIDRIDSSFGYTQDNCRFILACVNSFKGAASDADTMLVARALVAREN